MARKVIVIGLLVIFLAGGAWFFLLRRPTAPAVLIVDREGVGVRGQVTFTFDFQGRAQPQVWVAGNVVIFRVDQTLRSESGQAGRAYLITKDLKLKDVGSVDISKTDDDLAAEFGISTKKK